MLLLLFLSACGGSVQVKADISAYAEAPITIKGLGEDFVVTPAELADLECVKVGAAGKSDKAGYVTAVGPTLTTFLQAYDRDLTDFTFIRVTGSDGYWQRYAVNRLVDQEVILAVADGEKPLTNDQAPLRLLIPNMDASTWVRMINEIEFITD